MAPERQGSPRSGAAGHREPHVVAVEPGGIEIRPDAHRPADTRMLVGDLEPAAAAQALALRCGAAVVKRGHAGAVWSDASGVRSVPAQPADAVDSTGAGDAFAAGFLAGGAGATS